MPGHPIRQASHPQEFYNTQPQALQAAPTPQVANETVVRNHRLQQLTPQQFEQKLLNKLGNRLVPVRVEESANQSRFRLPTRDGSQVELTVDRENGMTTLVGTTKMVDSCLQIVQLLDVREVVGGPTTQFVPVQNQQAVIQDAANLLNRESQRMAQAQPAGQPVQRPEDGATRFVQPGATQQPGQLTEQGIAAALETVGSVVGPVSINVNSDLGIVTITGAPEDVRVVMSVLGSLEQISKEQEPLVELVQLEHGDCYRVNTLVQQLYSQIYSTRRGNLVMLPLIKPNTILMVGQKESIDTAKELVAKLDTPVRPNTQYQIFRLRNAAASELQTEITNFYNNSQRSGLGLEAQVYIISDYRTNSLIVQANPRDMLEVTTMIQKLDSPGSDVKNTVKTFPLKNAIASDLATTLQNALSVASTGTSGGFGGNQNSQSTMRSPALEFLNPSDQQILSAASLYDVRVVADTRSNMLIVSAPTETMPVIAALIAQLDQLPSAESQIKVFTLVNADAYTLTTMLTNLFASTSSGTGGFGTTGSNSSQIATVRPGIEETESTLVSVRFVSDIRTNSIIACGSAGDMSIVEALLLRLDEENMNNRKIIAMKLANNPASEIATIINDFVSQERQLETQNSTYLLPQSPLEQYRKEVIATSEANTNTLIVSTTPRYFEPIRKLVIELDERPLMVALQVLIAEVRMTHNRDRGIEIALQDSLLFNRGIAGDGPGFLFGNPSYGIPTGNVNPGTVGSQGITNFGTGRTNGNGIGGFTFAASSESVSVLVRALEEQGKIRVLSRPQITAMHNLRATISVGQDVPYVTSSDSNNSGGTTSATDYQKVGTILDVIPRITADEQVVMDVYIEKSSVGNVADGIPIAVSGGQTLYSPKINRTNAQTTVSAMDGETVVFAGLITEQKETLNRSVPFLNKIPVVKHFFEYDSYVCERSELLIIMTPTIIRSEADMAMIRQQETCRMHWCLSDVVKLTGNSKMNIRGDYYSPMGHQMEYIRTEPGVKILDDSQLPSDDDIRRILPVPTLAPQNN